MHELLALAFSPVQSARLYLNSSMLINESDVGDIAGLVDEQSKVGDPASGKGVVPTSPYFPTWTASQYPVHVAVDLGSECRVDRVFFYNETGGGPIALSSGIPFAWKAKKVNLEGYKQWIEIPLGERTRWLRLTLTQPISIPELIVYGRRLTPIAAPKPLGKPRPLPTMDQLIGVNAFIDDPVDVIAGPGGTVREYHSFSWDVENSDRKVRFQPSGAAGGNSWFFDDYYRKLKAAGCEVSPCIQGLPDWMSGVKANDDRPVAKGLDPEDPKSYQAHAKHLFQFAARYGSQKRRDAELDLAPGQPRLSGLGLIRWLENWNEPDRTWQGREARFTPYELAAMTSADYDGHRGLLGTNVGIKNADPKMKLAVAGLIGIKTDFFRAMKFWSDYHRGGSFPGDALNVHYYCSTIGSQGFTPDTKALTPEEDHLRERLNVLTDWRDANLPDKEVWLSEFGYDINPGSPICSPAIGSMHAEAVQAAWLVRSYFAIAAARVDRAPMFMLRDVDPKGTIQFSSSGLVGPKGDWKKKPSWFAITNLRRALKGMHFVGDVATGNPDVKAMQFSDGKFIAYAVWCPTRTDKRVENFRFKHGATQTFDLLTGSTTPLSPTTSLTISEMPTLLLTGKRK